MNRIKGAACAAVGVVALGAAVFWYASGDARTAAEQRSGVAASAAATPTSPVVISTPLPPQQHAGLTSGVPARTLSSGRAAAGSQPGNELFTYSKTDTPHREGPYTYYPVDIDVDQVFASALSGRLTFTAPDGSQLVLDYDKHITHGDGNLTWVGREDGGDATRDAIVTVGPDATFAMLPSSNGQQLRIVTVQGKTFVTSAAISELRPGVRDGGDTVVKAADVLLTGGSVSAPVVAAASVSNGIPLDVFIGYSTGYRSSIGSAAAVVTRLNYLIDVANRALSNSGVLTVSYRLVGSQEVSYADGTDNGIALGDLASTSTSSPLSTMRTARARYGADLVSFMRRYATEQNGCGLAYIPQAPYAINGREQTFSVVGDGTIDQGNGSYTYCPDTSLAHEMGHNLGAQHNQQVNSSGGLYSYSYGYRNDTAQFYDLMSYGLPGQEAELLYSNVGASTCKGLPCGDAASADVARTLRETMATASTFRASVVAQTDASVPGQIAGPGGRCLEAYNGETTNGTAVEVWACNGLRHQRWSAVQSTNGLQNEGTSSVIDAVGYGTTPGTYLQLWGAAGTSNQSWVFTRSSIYTAGDRVLDAVGMGTTNGTVIQLWDNNYTVNQRWSFNPHTGEIVNQAGRCLDVIGSGTANGTRVQLWDCTGADNQRFTLSSNGSFVGYGGKCLEAANGETANGTVVRMWECNSLPNQKWRLRGEIRGSQSNLCMEDPYIGQVNGSRVRLAACSQAFQQQWEFQPN